MKVIFSRLFNSRITVSLVAILAAASLMSCDRKSSTASGPAKIVIKGSNTVGEELAPRLITEYRKDHPDAVINLETRGTGSGFYGLFAGACDIATASRTMLTNEQAQAQARGIQLNDVVIGAYSVAVIVHASNPVTNLTIAQVRDLFTGAITNWKDVGGPDAPVHSCIRDKISGTYLGFRELAMGDKPYATNATAFTNYAAIAEAVGREANAIGYCSVQLAGKAGTKSVAIDGTPATTASVNEGKYPFARKLHFFTNKAGESPAAHDFIAFVQSSRGKQVMEDAGFVSP